MGVWVRSLVVALALFPVVAVADEATQWLERMNRAVHTLDYRGTFVYQHGERMETVEIVHRIANGEEQERISARTGAAREVLRDRGGVTCIQAEKGTVVETPGLPLHGLGLETEDGVERLTGHYLLKLEEGGRIAGRAARKLKIVPRDRFRYGYRLWLDEASALPLKSQLVGENGEILEQLIFTHLEHDIPIAAEALAPTLEGKRYTWEHQAPAGDAPPTAGRWRVERLPPGFHLSLESGHTLPNRPNPVSHLLYGDGLASVSVFIEPDAEGDNEVKKAPGGHRMGAVHAYSERRDGHRITVIGEVPAATVELIGASVRRSEAP